MNDVFRDRVTVIDHVIAMMTPLQSYEAEAGDVSFDAEFANLCKKVGYITQNHGESDDTIILHRKALHIRCNKVITIQH